MSGIARPERTPGKGRSNRRISAIVGASWRSSAPAGTLEAPRTPSPQNTMGTLVSVGGDVVGQLPTEVVEPTTGTVPTTPVPPVTARTSGDLPSRYPAAIFVRRSSGREQNGVRTGPDRAHDSPGQVA